MQPRLLSEPLRLAGAPILRLQSDERLVRLVRAGSHPAFAELVHRYRPALVCYTGRLVGADRAEDVVQQGLANAHTALMADERPIDVKPWLYRIVHNAALNVLRGARDVLTLDDHESELALPGVDAQVEQRERFRSVISAVQALPTAQRDALLLRELEGRSHEEIAAALGVTAGAARQHLMRARATMRAAVTAVTPYPLVLKLAALGTGTGAGATAAEAVTGAGAGLTLSKLGAGVLAAGALAGGTGVVVPAIGPEPRTERGQGPARPAGSPGSGARGSSVAPAPGAATSRVLPAARGNTGRVSRENDDADSSGRRKDASRERENRSGEEAAGRDDHRSPGTTSPVRDEEGLEGAARADDDRADQDHDVRESAAKRGSSGDSSRSGSPGSGADSGLGSGSGSSGSGSSDSGSSGSSSSDSGSASDSDSSGSGSRDDGDDRIDHSDGDAVPGRPIVGAAADG